MKKSIYMLILGTAFFAQQGLAQDSTQQVQLARLLHNYDQTRDALVSGDGSLAAASAAEFIRTANSIDYKQISEGNINALLKDASPISETTDLKIQRRHFAGLSENMIILAKALKFSSQPIYQVYCPMKKANWLTPEKTVKNPYYGNAMLNCGNIVETIKH